MPVSTADLVEYRHDIAPIWHTWILIAIVFALGLGGAASGPLSSHRALPSYVIAIVFEWLLFAFVWWGIRLRKYPLSALISRGRVSWPQRDLVFGIAIWIVWYVIESLVALGLAHSRITNAGARGAIFPHGALEIAVWVVMAASSGFSEELAFRGYLLQQFSRWSGNAITAVILQALLFGIGHAYLGMRQAVLIMISGVVLGLFAAWFRNIRPLMVTHAWADIFGGILVHGLPFK